MNVISMIARLSGSAIIFIYLVVVWALVPFYDPSVGLDLTVISVFYGNDEPVGVVRDLLLASRALLGITLSLYVFVPALLIFVEFPAKEISKIIATTLGLLCVVVFFASLIVFHLFYI